MPHDAAQMRQYERTSVTPTVWRALNRGSHVAIGQNHLVQAGDRLSLVRDRLRAGDIYVLNEESFPHGTRLWLHNDAIVNVYDSGTVQVQGKQQDATRAALGDLVLTRAHAPKKAASPPPAIAEGFAQCPDCSRVVTTAWRRCVWCGSDLHGEEVLRCTCGTAVAAPWEFCPECGNALK